MIGPAVRQLVFSMVSTPACSILRVAKTSRLTKTSLDSFTSAQSILSLASETSSPTKIWPNSLVYDTNFSVVIYLCPSVDSLLHCSCTTEYRADVIQTKSVGTLSVHARSGQSKRVRRGERLISTSHVNNASIKSPGIKSYDNAVSILASPRFLLFDHLVRSR